MFRPKRGDPRVSEQFGEVHVMPKRDVRLDLGMLINAIPEPHIAADPDQSKAFQNSTVPRPFRVATGSVGSGPREGKAARHAR